jgi:hypothetical protein
MIIFTNLLIPKRFAAFTVWPFIFIRPEYKDDEGLKAHEEVHWNQVWQSCFLQPILYLFSKKRRLAYEVAAYREQMTYPNADPELYAKFIATKYNLDITPAEALELLK